MTKYHRRIILLAMLAIGLLSGCKVEVYVPEGGSVVTASGRFSCDAGQICRVEVNDIYFDETFIAQPAEGYVFTGWRKRHRGLCGGSTEHCHLVTSGMEGDPELIAVLESDQVFYLEPRFDKAAPLLVLYGGDEQQFYLGCINCPAGHVESVCNASGNYGSAFAPYSIWNESGDFGSLYTNYSPWNIFATAAPAIFDTNGQFYGYLTANRSQPNRTTLGLLVQLADYAADPQYSLPAVRDWFCN